MPEPGCHLSDQPARPISPSKATPSTTLYTVPFCPPLISACRRRTRPFPPKTSRTPTAVRQELKLSDSGQAALYDSLVSELRAAHPRHLPLLTEHLKKMDGREVGPLEGGRGLGANGAWAWAEGHRRIIVPLVDPHWGIEDARWEGREVGVGGRGFGKKGHGVVEGHQSHAGCATWMPASERHEVFGIQGERRYR